MTVKTAALIAIKQRIFRYFKDGLVMCVFKEISTESELVFIHYRPTRHHSSLLLLAAPCCSASNHLPSTTSSILFSHFFFLSSSNIFCLPFPPPPPPPPFSSNLIHVVPLFFFPVLVPLFVPLNLSR